MKENRSTASQSGRKISIVVHRNDSGSNESVSEKHNRWPRDFQSRSRRTSFTTWRFCYNLCKPCRWFDSIEYEQKISKCCLRFKTFKTLGTILLIGVYLYIYMYSVLGEDVFPGGTIFFLFLLFLASYISGYVISLIGLPPMLAYLLIGIVFEKIPLNSPLRRNNDFIKEFAFTAEKVLLLIALIRAGLLLDVSRIKNHILFILRLSLLPSLCEFIIVCVMSHFLLRLPWDWSALQGSLMCVVSLASITSIMEKNRHSGYGEDKHLCTMLIAASVSNVIFGLLLYVVCITYLLPEGAEVSNGWKSLLIILKQILLGVLVGGISGLLLSFFPDKRNSEVAAIRILIIGVASVAIANVFYELHMPAASVLGCVTMCVSASNMWVELGWHQDGNPVQYFYTMAYYFGQPIALSLVGYTAKFTDGDKAEVGLAIAVLAVGLIGREIVCFLTSTSKSYPTTMKERIFICTAWVSKGTFQILLAFAVKYIILKEYKNIDKNTMEELLSHAKTIKQNTMVVILLTTPLVCLVLTILSPVLLTTTEDFHEGVPEGAHRGRRRTSLKFIGAFDPTE